MPRVYLAPNLFLYGILWLLRRRVYRTFDDALQLPRPLELVLVGTANVLPGIYDMTGVSITSFYWRRLFY